MRLFRHSIEPLGLRHWFLVSKFSPLAVSIVDGRGPSGDGRPHYSRRSPGAPQFAPPGDTICLMSMPLDAVWVWWRPNPASGIKSMNGLDGWTCSLFRNDGPVLSSLLILDAELALVVMGVSCGPDGMLSYVWPAKVASRNPGYCYQRAGWKKRGWSADGRKRLFGKAFEKAGMP